MLEAPDMERAPAARLGWGYSDTIRIGEPTLAIGAPPTQYRRRMQFADLIQISEIKRNYP